MTDILSHSQHKMRAEELLQRFFDDELTDEEGTELLAIWDDCPECETAAQEEYRIEAPLVFFDAFDKAPDGSLGSLPSPNAVMGLYEMLKLEELVSLASTSPSLPVPLPTSGDDDRPSPKTKPRTGTSAASRIDDARQQKRFFWLLVPTLILCAVAVYFELRPASLASHSGKPVAKIVESIEAEWEDGMEEFKVGRELTPCTLKLRSGVVKLQFTRGAEVVLEGPCDFLVKRCNAAFCQFGKLSADVPPSGVGFEIASPTATVVDLGTRFSMQVSEGRSDVHVLKGKVEVKQSAAYDNLLLTEGLAGLFNLHAVTPAVPADPTTFFSEKKLSERKTAYVAQRQAVWDEQIRRQAADPSLVYSLNGDRTVSLSGTSGSRPGKTAYRFGSKRDRIALHVDRDCRSLTLVASIRLERLDHFSHAILVGNDYYNKHGKFFWQLDRSGFLQFHLNDGGVMRRFKSPVVVEPHDRNTWMNIALVADADRKTIVFYADGEVVSTSPWETPAPLRIGDATIGNESVEQQRTSTRFFGGSIEDFFIYDRALSPEEIRECYDNNR